MQVNCENLFIQKLITTLPAEILALVYNKSGLTLGYVFWSLGLNDLNQFCLFFR